VLHVHTKIVGLFVGAERTVLTSSWG